MDRLLLIADILIIADQPLPVDLQTDLMAAGVDVSALTQN